MFDIFFPNRKVSKRTGVRRQAVPAPKPLPPKPVTVRVKMDGDFDVPAKQHSGDAGFDIKAIETKTIPSGHTEVFNTGIHIEVPQGYVTFIFARSGLSFKRGITLSNAIGVIDSGYRGEIKLNLINLSREDQTINKGDRIAQAVVVKLPDVQFVKADALSPSSDGRNEQGFGSTDEKPSEKTDSHKKTLPMGRERYSDSLFRDFPVMGFDLDTHRTTKYANPCVALISIYQSMGEKDDEINARRVWSYASVIKKIVKEGNGNKSVLNRQWNKANDSEGAITVYDLKSIPKGFTVKHTPFNGRRNNEGKNTTSIPVTMYLGDKRLFDFESLSQATAWLDIHDRNHGHYAESIRRNINTGNSMYGYKWVSK